MAHTASVNDNTLYVTTYKGSPINFLVVPLADGAGIDLSTYDQIDWSWWTGTPETPGTKQVDVRLTGLAPLYLSVEDLTGTEGIPDGAYGVRLELPQAASYTIPAGQYYAELWITPGGGEKQLTGIAYFNHLPTTAVS